MLSTTGKALESPRLAPPVILVKPDQLLQMKYVPDHRDSRKYSKHELARSSSKVRIMEDLHHFHFYLTHN